MTQAELRELAKSLEGLAAEAEKVAGRPDLPEAILIVLERVIPDLRGAAKHAGDKVISAPKVPYKKIGPP
jgi:hypothetical protein